MELIGKLKKLNDVVERTSSNSVFKSRKVWIVTEENPQYPQTIEIELQQDKVDIMNGISIDAPIKCYCNLRGREWTKPETKVTSVFNSITCWKVEGLPGGVQQGTQAVVAQPVQQSSALPDLDSDLPF